MAKTATSGPNRAERGAALLEAALALGLVAFIAAAGLSAFGGAARTGAEAEARLLALGAASNALELASAPAFLEKAREAGGAELTGEGWRVSAAPYDDGGTEESGPLALIRLTAEAGPEGAPLVTLETLRSLPR